MKQSKENADCEDLDFETAYEETPFDEEEFRWTPRLIYDYIGEYVHGQYGADRLLLFWCTITSRAAAAT